MMKLSDFDYELPKELIAQYPAKVRDSCRLLVVDRKSGAIEHRKFSDITKYLRAGDLVVLNNTRVRTCRLKGKRKTGGALEVFLLRKKEGLCFDVMLKPGRVKIGETFCVGNPGITGTLTGVNEVTFEAKSADDVYARGQIPLPPYIKRSPEASDAVYYQTVYAAIDGSVASPTAGLHFTPSLLNKIKDQGVDLEYVSLHVGLATFKSVTALDIRQHKMGSEYFSVPQQTQGAIACVRSRGAGRIIAVGTTSCRTLETYAKGVSCGLTDLFMYPGHSFKLVDGLLTNFHLPRTTLFMLVCAFGGTGLVRAAYDEAVRQKYRFYSYGDAMLVL
jgi:S-adenosylmethionine:tRNA ribosyltransferase-isomerase